MQKPKTKKDWVGRFRTSDQDFLKMTVFDRECNRLRRHVEQVKTELTAQGQVSPNLVTATVPACWIKTAGTLI